MKIFTSKTQKTGERGELAAVTFLKKQGFSIVERNVANTFGEIDIIAQKGKIVYFFEVKAGYADGFINPAENLHPAKLRKFFKSIEYYCLVNKVGEYRAQGIIVLFDRSGGQNREVTVETIDLF